MKIIYCIAGTFNSGGMERVLANKANYLVAHGYEVVIVTTDQKERAPYFALDSRIQQKDLGVNYADNQNVGVFKKILSYIRKQKLHRERLSAVMNREKADIVISMFDHEASFLYDIDDGSKKVLEVHFSRYKRLQYGRKGVYQIIDRYRSRQDLSLVRRYARFVVLTKEDAEYWGNLSNIEVIPNANSFVSETKALCDEKRVIAVGRYDYQKGFEDLIAAWKYVSDKHPEWMLAIFGHGPLKEEMLKQINELELSNSVRLEKPVQNIKREYLHSSILAMSSRYEGLPMTLLEAQSCGLPIAAYACKCGPRDIITNGKSGFLIEEGNIRELADRLVQLIEDPELRKSMGREGVLNSEEFGIEKIMWKWESLFNDLLL